MMACGVASCSLRITPPTLKRFLTTLSVQCAAAIAFAVAAASLKAEEAAPVNWSQLPSPSAQEFEDPYRDLPPKQMSDLMSLVRLREELRDDALPTERRAQLKARVSGLEADLQATGIDVEWLLSQRWIVADRRREAAVAVDSTLDGQLVEIAGFLVPAPSTDESAASAYLLPDRGVCSHLPPPAPNQLVRLELASAPDIGSFCAPTIVRGRLRVEESRHEAFVIDDAVPMWSAWALKAEKIVFD